MSSFFGNIEPVRYEGPDSENPLAFRWYDPERQVFGQRMEDVLRAAVCYWHTFTWPGTDPFGGPTFDRPWFSGDSMENARLKADVAFEFFRLLGNRFFCFHDRDIAPEGETLAQSNRNVREIADVFQDKMERQGMKLLWGTANLFGHKRYMAGAGTNPDPDVFMYAAAQVKNCLEVTHQLNGANYVLWGGREGYETLLNTDIGQELDQAGRFLSMVVEHKHKIGFKGTILVEPKPQEPTKHQYDFDVNAIYGFLKRYGLENEVRANIEVGHAFLAGHSFEHEVALAVALGIFGSVDMNRNDPQSGWDTDQFPNNVEEVALGLYYIMRGGGFGTGGINFDAKLRRQSIDPEDLLHGHVGGLDTCARALLMAERMHNDGKLARFVADRYAGWSSEQGRAILDGKESLESIAQKVDDRRLIPEPRSGRQEFLENLVGRYLD